MRVHTRKRGDVYHYVCRVPRDLQHHFPTTQITHSLKTDNERDAKIAATAAEYRTQQLFLQLRTGMLSKDLEKHLIAMFLQRGLEDVEAIANGSPTGLDKAVEKKSRELAELRGCSPQEAREALAKAHDTYVAKYTSMLSTSDTAAIDSRMHVVEAYLEKHHDLKLSRSEKQALALKLLNAVKQVQEAQSAVYRGEWSLMEQLREKVDRDLASPYYDLKTVLEKYQEHYLATKPNLKQGSKDDMAVECRTLLEILGNVSVTDFNTMESVTKLKKILLRYPKNKKQRFGDKSIHSILKERQLYEVINPKTANNYLDRARQVVEFASKSKFLNAANVDKG